MDKSEKITGGPFWTQNWIEAMWRFTSERFMDFDTGTVDFEALGREEYEFRKALFFRNFKNSPRAREAFEAAADDYSKKVANGQKGGRPRKNQVTADGDIREDSQAKPDGSAITINETRAYDALEPSANQFTADASTREGEDERDHRGNTGTLESSTSANIYGDAATREGAEVVDSRESGAAVPTTVSRNMRRVPQNESPAHGFSGGRTAQGTMSRSPEAAAQSGKAYDQETDQVSTDEARQGQARESQGRTGGSSVRGIAKVAQPSVRSRASFRNKEDFIQWAIDDGLDPVDAGECWEATEERGGKDADGNTVKNMKAFARQWCRTRANNRRTA